MYDLLQLGFEFKAKGADQTKTKIDGIENSAEKLEKRQQRVRKSTDALNASFGRAIGVAARLAGAYLSVGAALQAAESYTGMENSLRVLGMEGDQVARTLEDIAGVANRTRSPLEAMAGLYQKVSIAGKDLGTSQADVLRFTENIGLALAQQGGSTEAASGALLQLGQALSGGTVRAEEFNSILEGAFPIAQAAANGIDAAAGSVGKLRAMVIEGEISSKQFFEAVMSQSDALEEAFGKTVPTIGQAMTVLGNNFTMFIGKLNSSTGVTAKFAEVIMGLANNIERLITYAAVAATAYGVTYVGGMVAAAAATATLSGALKVLRTALYRTGIGALIALAGELVLAFMDAVETTGSVGKAFVLMGEVGAGVFEGLVGAAQAIPPGLASVWNKIKQGFLNMVSDLVIEWAVFLRGVAQSVDGIPAFAETASALGDAAQNAILTSSELAEKAMQAGSKSSALGAEASKLANEGFAKARAALDKLNATVDETGNKTDNTTNSTNQLNDALDDTGGKAGGKGKAGKAAKELKKLSDEVERLEFDANPLLKYNKELAHLDELARNHGLTDGAFLHAVEKLNEELANSNPTIKKVGDAIGDFVADGMRDFGSLIDSFKNMIKEMIATAIANPIKLALVGATYGGSAGAAAAGAAGAPVGGGGGLLGSLLGGGGAGGGGLLSGILGSATAGTGLIGGFSSVLSSFGMSGFGGAASSIGAALGGATAGLGGLATAIGAVAAPLLAVAAVFSFFKSKTKELDSGLRVTVDGMDSVIESFRYVEKSRFWGLSKKRRTYYDELSAEDADPLKRVVHDLQMGILDAAEALGVGSDAFSDFSYQMQISTKDMSEDEAQQAIAEALQGLTDEFAGMIPGLEELQREGEGAADALTRISQSLAAVNTVMDTLSHTLFDASLTGGAAASDLIDFFGGLEAFNSATTAYFTGFYSEQERFDTAIRQLEDRFGELNAAMPQTRAQFRDLIESLDLGTEYGRQMYAALMSMSGALNEVLPAVDNFSIAVGALVGSVTTEIDDMIGSTSDAMRANEQAATLWYRTATTLREFISDLRSTASSLISGPDALAFSQARFQTLLASAVAGDNQAATDLAGAARSLLTNSDAMAKSAFEQARAQARVMSDLQLAAGVADIEGARNDAVAGLLGQQVDLLEQVRDAINSGSPLDADDVDALNAQLGELQGAIAAAEMINYNFLKERLSVSVDLIADADIPDSLRTMLDNAATGISANIDYIARTDALTPDLRWLAMTAASEHIKTIDYVVGDDIAPENRWIATTAVSALTKTINLTIGEDLTHDQMRVALAGSSEMSRVVNVSLHSGASDEAIRLALGNVNQYQVTVSAALQSGLPEEVQRLVLAQQGDYAAIIGAAMAADISEPARRILLTRQGQYIARIGAILEPDMPNSHRTLLLNANTAATRAITVLMGYGQNLTQGEREMLVAQSHRIDKTIDGYLSLHSMNRDKYLMLGQGNETVNKTMQSRIGLVDFSSDKLKMLQQSTETVNKTIRGAINLSSLSPDQRGFLSSITGATTGRITLGGSFQFDPSTGFSTWFSQTTRSNITSPMDAMRVGMAGLRGSLSSLSDTIRAETASREIEAARAARIGEITAAAMNSTFLSREQGNAQGVVTSLQNLLSETGVRLMNGGSEANIGIDQATGGIDYSGATHYEYGSGADVEEFRRRFYGSSGLQARIFNTNAAVDRALAQLQERRDQIVELGGIPTFASGGPHAGGLRIVGEQGPELEATGKSRIYNAKQTRQMLGGSNEELIKEVKEMRQEIRKFRDQQRQLDMNSGNDLRKIRLIEERREIDGMPPERVE